MRATIQQENGFALIETVVAALLLGASMVGIMKIEGETLVSSSTSRTKTFAINAAQSRMEQFRGYKNQSEFDAIISGSRKFTETGKEFTEKWVISPCANSINCKVVNIEVQWLSNKGENDKVELTSFIAHNNPTKLGSVLLGASAPAVEIVSSTSEPPVSELPVSEPPVSEPPPPPPPPPTAESIFKSTVEYINSTATEQYFMGSRGADYLSGIGKITAYLGRGNDQAWGDDGDNEIHGGTGDDRIYGGGGDDKLYGDWGNDKLYGDGGDDVLFGSKDDLSSHTDIMEGGSGDDYFNFSYLIGTANIYGNSATTPDNGQGSDSIIIDAGADLGVNTGDWSIIIDGVTTKINPSNSFGSLDLKDKLGKIITSNGGVINFVDIDNISWGKGSQVVPSDNLTIINLLDDFTVGKYKYTYTKTIVGGPNSDSIKGGGQNEDIYGLTGNDSIKGGGGNDRLFGGIQNGDYSQSDGSDFLYGEDGDDWLLGGRGTDTLYGGAGVDIFVSGNAYNSSLDKHILNGGSGDDFFRLGLIVFNVEIYGNEKTIPDAGDYDTIVIAPSLGNQPNWTITINGVDTVFNPFIDHSVMYLSNASGIIKTGDGGTVTFTDIDRIVW